MSRTLVLMRHAKSDYPLGVADHDRPLAPRGIREAGLAGEWLRTNVPRLDAVLCSTATRTRETLARTGLDAPVSFVDNLYDAMPGTVIEEINAVGDDVDTLLVIAHEPAMSHVTLGLTDRDESDPRAVEQVLTKYPTSGIAVLQSNAPWHRWELGSAALVTFHVPR